MSETLHSLPKAKIQRDAFSWFIWALPIGALVLCGWFVLHDFVFAGPTITIYFQQAEGIQEQNSMVRYRGIAIGEVKSLKLTKDSQGVIVRAQLYHSAANVARQGSIFWIVRPEVKLGAISGLRTIVSGNYITVQPGGGDRTNVFIGFEEAPITPVPGIVITLLADDLDAIQNQSAIFYRGVQVGEVLDFRLGNDARHVVVHARIQEQYAPLVRVDSKFWNAGGINAHLGLFSGLDISAESAGTMISGGIAFATPEDYGAPATNGSLFILNDTQESKWQAWNPTIPLPSVPQGENIKSTLPELHPR